MKNAHDYLIVHNIHPSLQRLAIMNYLMCNHTHPTADEIFTALTSEMPTLSKTTIYNTLKLFSEKGAIQVVTIDEKNAHFDGNPEIHPHFYCRKCGKIYDIALQKGDVLEKQFACNPNLKGFSVEQTQIYHSGICPTCKKSEQ